MTGSTAALVSLEESSGLLPERAGVEGAQQVERAAEALGTERADEERGKEGPSSPDHVPGNGRHRSAHACGGSRRPHGQTAGWLREDPRGQGGHCVDRRIPRRGRTPLRDPGSVTDAAAMESAAAADLNPDRSDFAERVPPRSHAGAASPQPRVAWCWAMAQLGSGTPPANGSLKPLRCSTGITPNQLYTAPLHPFSARSSESTHGATARCAELGDGKLPAVVHALLAHRTSRAEATPCALYLFHSRARMRYPRFHSQGLCTSTGVVEAGCQVAIGTRLQRAGMHGTVQGANALIALRCCKLSGRYEDFWERRGDRIAA